MTQQNQYTSLPLDDSLVVVRHEVFRIFVLNESGRLLFERLVTGNENRDEVVAAFVQKYGIAATQAAADIDATLAQWEQSGLIGPVPTTQLQGMTFAPIEIDSYEGGGRRTYLFGGVTFTIEYPFTLFEELFHPYFGSFVVENRQSSVLFQIHHTGTHWDLMVDGSVLRSAVNPLDLINYLSAQIGVITNPGREIFMTLHAGAVEKQGKVLVAPAWFGSGKSTLTATLVHAGYTYFSDDSVPVMAADFGVVPFPQDLCVKEGSWALLQSRYPQLANTPPARVIDVRPRKYVKPSRPDGATPFTPLPVTALIFPAYSPGATPTFIPVPPADALYRIAQSGTFIPGDPVSVARLVEWIQKTPAYDFPFDDLDAAVKGVDNFIEMPIP